jgi:phage gp29-like protein
MATKKTGKDNSTPARVPTRPVVLDAAHCWLERTNPLAGVSIRTAQNIWDAARGGDTQRLHWLFNEIERANPILFTCIERRQAAIAGFQLKVSVLPSMEGSLADEQKDAVESFVAGIENFTEMLEHLDSAFFRGFALAQPIWEEDATVHEIRLHNSWEFLVHDGVLYHNPECNGFSSSAVSCADAGLIGIQRSRAIDYPALSIHIRHAVSERDWGRFLERYALPKPAVTMAPNATNAQRDDYLRAARAVENGQVSVWPSGSSITDFAGGSRGTDPFNSFIDHQEKLIVLLATGGTLTSLAQADTGSLAGGAQMKVWQEIVRRDAGVLSQAVMRSLIKPFLAAKFGAQPCAVDFSLDFPSERGAQDAANVAATLMQAGWRVDQGELEKAVGFTLEKEESAPQMPAFAKAKAKTPLQNDENRLQNAPRVSDGQGDPSGEDALVEALSGLFEKTLAEAAAEAVEKEEKQDEE